MTKILTALVATLFAVSAFAAYAPIGERQTEGAKQVVAAEKSEKANDMLAATTNQKPKKRQPKRS